MRVLTPVDGDGQRCEPVEVNLDHVLWMEATRDGTVLSMNQVEGDGSGYGLINCYLKVAESRKEILWSVLD